MIPAASQNDSAICMASIRQAFERGASWKDLQVAQIPPDAPMPFAFRSSQGGRHTPSVLSFKSSILTGNSEFRTLRPPCGRLWVASCIVAVFIKGRRRTPAVQQKTVPPVPRTRLGLLPVETLVSD